MNSIKKIVLGTLFISMVISCSAVAKFPVSSYTPAAEISATKKKDKNNNYAITVNTHLLASTERLNPPMKTYVVWITTSNDGIKNIGQLQTKNGKNAHLNTLTVYNPVDIFITAEDEGNVSYPRGIEISRSRFK